MSRYFEMHVTSKIGQILPRRREAFKNAIAFFYNHPKLNASNCSKASSLFHGEILIGPFALKQAESQRSLFYMQSPISVFTFTQPLSSFSVREPLFRVHTLLFTQKNYVSGLWTDELSICQSYSWHIPTL